MAQILRENPNVTIEMGAHTDRKGTDEYNINLSNRRAQSVIDYLISAGIAADRLFPKGYGESTPKTVTKRINREFPNSPKAPCLMRSISRRSLRKTKTQPTKSTAAQNSRYPSQSTMKCSEMGQGVVSIIFGWP